MSGRLSIMLHSTYTCLQNLHASKLADGRVFVSIELQKDVKMIWNTVGEFEDWVTQVAILADELRSTGYSQDASFPPCPSVSPRVRMDLEV